MEQLTLSNIRARALLAPLPRPITTAVGAIERAPLILIDLETREGVIGTSYLFGYSPLVLGPVTKMIENLGAHLSGSPADPGAIFRRLERDFLLLGREGLVTMAIAGIDMALWDAQGKAAGRSVADLLGATARPIAAYESHGIFDEARDRDAIEGSLARGFRALKFRLGAGDLCADLDALRGFRAIVGPEIDLMVDYNQSLDADDAIRRINALAEVDRLVWIEEPIPAHNFAGYRKIRSSVSTPIQAGENWWLPSGAMRAIEGAVSDLAMPDMMKIGGFSGWMETSGLLNKAKLPISSHIFIEASAHTLAATPGAHMLEYMDMAGGVLEEPYGVMDGALQARGPGLGIAWDEAAIARLS